jgi:hypothetical protein
VAGDGGDDEIVFDDDFVKGAAVSEQDWRTRQEESAKRARKERRGERRRRNRARARHAAWYVAIAALVVVLVGVAGYGPLSFMKRDSAKSSHAAKSVSSTKAKKAKKSTGPTTTSTTIFHLERRSYSLGDCVTFDQRPGEDTRETHVVNCSKPHLMEMTNRHELTGKLDHFPTDAEWLLIDTRDCGPGAQKLIGAPLDPDGRYYATAIQPSADSWAVGDREMWCGVGRRSFTRPPRESMIMPFTGKVEGTAQDLVAPVGSCWGDAAYVVPCGQPHKWEVTGVVDLTGKVAQPPAADDDHGWNALVGDACHTVARGYLGRDVVGEERAGWEPIQPGSWAAGRRRVECNVARYFGDQAVPVVGSLKG